MARRILLQVLSVEELLKDTITANIAEATAKKVLWTLKVHSFLFSRTFLVVFYQI